jgi:hypothetical protein
MNDHAATAKRIRFARKKSGATQKSLDNNDNNGNNNIKKITVKQTNDRRRIAVHLNYQNLGFSKTFGFLERLEQTG